MLTPSDTHGSSVAAAGSGELEGALPHAASATRKPLTIAHATGLTIRKWFGSFGHGCKRLIISSDRTDAASAWRFL